MKLSERLSERPRHAAAVHQPKAAAARGERSDEWSALKRRVHEAVVAELGPMLARREPLDLASEVQSRLDAAIAAVDIAITPAQRRRFFAEVTAEILGYGPLEPLLADPTVSEVMVNGPDEVWVERSGLLERCDVRFDDERQLRQVIDRIVAAVGRRVDESSPLCDARLPDGSRVNVVLPPLSLRGPCITVRKFPENPLLMEDLVRLGTLSEATRAFLQAAVLGKVNIVVSGGTGTGKTTFLNAVSQAIPVTERIISIEDAAELQLHQPHVVPLETRPANAEGTGRVTVRDLVVNALRMRPDRIVVGEVRGPEALDMLQAMNTGHEGSLTTLHANSPRDALSRLETMVLMAGVDLGLRAVRDQIASAIELVVHLDRLPDGRRVVTAITEVQGMEAEVVVMQDLFRYASGSPGSLRPTGLRPRLLDKLEAAGVTVPAGMFVELPVAARGKARR
jgi:pilus assembly protein CpaF